MNGPGKILTFFSFGLGLGLVQSAMADQISTAAGAGADIEVRERSDDSNGGREYANTRWNATDRNEVVGLRFDLTGYDLSTLQNASLNLINYRTNSERRANIYAVTPGATGGTGTLDTETWSEGNVATWGDFPGLEITDGTDTTLSIDTNQLTLLVDTFTITNLTEGTVESATSAALVDYLKNLPGTTVTLLLTQGLPTSGGQYRFATKEADTLDSGTITGLPGDFAPFLDIDAVPIIFTTNKVTTVADLEMNEATGNASSNDPDLNTRFNASSANEVVGMRFEVGGFDLSKAQQVSLNLVNYRTDSQPRFVDVYAVTPGAVAPSGTNTTETWDEDNVNLWNDFPGLLATDTDFTTLSIDTNLLTLLVDDYSTANLGEGTVESVVSAALSAYFKDLTNDTVTLLLTQGGGGSGGQFKFASKEADALATLGGSAGQFAPFLEILAPLPTLNITDVALAAGPSVVLTWDAKSGRTYGVERTTDSLTASNWVSVAASLPGESINTYTDTAPAEVSVAYRVINEGEVPPAVFLDEDFESDPTGWVASNDATTTDWEWGAPVPYLGVGADGPPKGAQGGANVYGTDLDDDYVNNVDIRLYSPVVDLTGAAAATLRFGNYFETEQAQPSDFCELYIRDAGFQPIAGLESALRTYSGTVAGFDWQTETVDLPLPALDRTIRLEFRFVSDPSGGPLSGWYIDNVLVSD